jgi:hypothetical protein
MPSRGRICRQAAIRVVLRADRGHAWRMAGRRGLSDRERGQGDAGQIGDTLVTDAED